MKGWDPMRWWTAILLLPLLLSTASEARSLHDRQEVWLRAIANVQFPHVLPHRILWEDDWDAWAFVACGPTIVIPKHTSANMFDWLAPHELGHILHLTRDVDWREYRRLRRVQSDHEQYLLELFAEDFRWLFAPSTQYRTYAYHRLGPPHSDMRAFFLAVGRQQIIRMPSFCDSDSGRLQE